jgi:hypothetical protein
MVRMHATIALGLDSDKSMNSHTAEIFGRYLLVKTPTNTQPYCEGFLRRN